MAVAAAVLAVLLFLSAGSAAAEPTADRASLQAFLSQTPHLNRIRWDPRVSTCEWVGVTCDSNRSAVVELRLPGAGLLGTIPPSTLGRLSSLRVLSLRSNALSGDLPSDVANLTLLHSLYLQNNHLSGEFPATVTKLSRLSHVDLSGNNFSGEIPFAVTNLTRLTKLYLQDNNFSGILPSIDVDNLTEFNVSNNKLNGSIPTSLARFPASSFSGNLDLCGGPLRPCSPPFFPSPAESPSAPKNNQVEKSSKKLSTAAIIAIAVGAAVVGALLLLLLLCLLFKCRKRRRGKDKSKKGISTAAASAGRSGDTAATASSSTSKEIGGGVREEEKNRLVFVGKAGWYSFDLEDLLRASAEVLGKGSVGTSYKAVLEEGTTVVVKRLKDVAVNKREFEAYMETLGSTELDHPNLLPLRAYYFSRDEKLLVFDYLPPGSLSSLLHGSRGSGRPPLDWDARMRVALAAARGLAHLHSSARLIHGNLKASNILLRHDSPSSAAAADAVVSDYGLTPLFNPSAPLPSRVAGYRAPEVLESRRPTFKSDVYSLGVLLLELLTGRAPNQATVGGDEGVDLPRWVQSVVREEWTAEVFDAELARQPGIEEEMVRLLQVAMACVAPLPDSRPDALEVLRMVEEIAGSRGLESDDGRRPSTDDPSRSGGSGVPTPPAAVTP